MKGCLHRQSLIIVHVAVSTDCTEADIQSFMEQYEVLCIAAS